MKICSSNKSVFFGVGGEDQQLSSVSQGESMTPPQSIKLVLETFELRLGFHHPSLMTLTLFLPNSVLLQPEPTVKLCSDLADRVWKMLIVVF